MPDLHFTPAEVDRLRFERFHHPHPHVQRKMEALLLKSDNLPRQQIARITGVCENTLPGYFAQYHTGGIEALKALNFYQPASALAGPSLRSRSALPGPSAGYG